VVAVVATVEDVVVVTVAVAVAVVIVAVAMIAVVDMVIEVASAAVIEVGAEEIQNYLSAPPTVAEVTLLTIVAVVALEAEMTSAVVVNFAVAAIEAASVAVIEVVAVFIHKVQKYFTRANPSLSPIQMSRSSKIAWPRTLLWLAKRLPADRNILFGLDTALPASPSRCTPTILL
jgi:hypothetical protein